ncbi:hypothetical protein Poli38472_006577 [Pythium oligandrum]|uniref:Histone-lysine N-methyltransferase n=1 Tax=Pythium oligandrum TaxID=41045 RepID=A0A8K1FEF2_PYTOL|nr:hypothetical protein Poli38472_006577 [Pythium oligandrum]|eukprot:TMW56567.1 hypothetical protein Poli38472_006577 [Pythium oligandrum]
MAATRSTQATRPGKTRRLSSRVKHPVQRTVLLVPGRIKKEQVAMPELKPEVLPEPVRELTDAEIAASLPYAEVLEPEVKHMLTVLRRQTMEPMARQPFSLPFTAEEIKTIGHRKMTRHPPPYGRISKSIYLSRTLPVADLPVHKCNCYEEKTASSTSRRQKEPHTPRKRRAKSVLMKKKKKTVPEPTLPNVEYCGEGCHNRMLFISCSAETCSAPDPSLCSNRAIVRKEAKPVRVEYIEGPGFGLFADETIEANEFVIEYVGEVIDDEECERRLIKCRDVGETHFYMLEIEKDIVIDARYRSNEARFINHSCDPNCVTQKWNVDGLQRIGIFARRRVLPGEEITIDYNFSHFGDPIDCKCGSAACTGKIGLKRSHMQLQASLAKLSSSRKTQEHHEPPPPELKRPVLLTSLALLKSAKLDMEWLNLYGFKKRRLFVGHKKATNVRIKTEPEVLTDGSAVTSTASLSSRSSEGSSTPEDSTSASRSPQKSRWYERFQRGEHLAEMRRVQTFLCGGKSDWTSDLKSLKTKKPPQSTKKLVSKRRSLLEARARVFADLIAFANGTSPWNKRIPSSKNINPDRIYRFIDAMKNGKQYLNHNLNDLHEDVCNRCGLAGELICCDGCPAAFHLNCTNLAFLPPPGEAWFCTSCKRSARQRAQIEKLTVPIKDEKQSDSTKTARRNLRTHAMPVVPSRKRIFHTTSTKEIAKRRGRKRAKTNDRSYRLLEQMPLPTWDDDDDEE